MLRKLLYLFLLILYTFPGISQQINTVVDIDFNNCQVTDKGSMNVGIELGGAPACVCGLESDALSFDGANDYLAILDDISPVLNNDFTLSFYIRIDNSVGNSIDLFSLQKSCQRDSSITFKYIPAINEFRLDIVKSLARSTQINFKQEEGNCWQHIIIVRDGFDYLAYLNGRLVGQASAETDYVFSPDALFAIANSPCVGTSDVRFEGSLESLKIYDSPLNEIQIQSLNLFPDMILNNDTTLLMGESIQIEMGPNCSDNFFWSNSQDLDDPNSLSPIITPQETAVYQISFQNGACISEDSISIFLQDPEDLECDKLLLPNAFSPNGDDLNERFEISNKFIVDEILSFDIYSRLGNRVFHGESKTSSWDGTYLGEKLNPAKFAYLIEYECGDEVYEKRGIVTLVR